MIDDARAAFVLLYDDLLWLVGQGVLKADALRLVGDRLAEFDRLHDATRRALSVPVLRQPLAPATAAQPPRLTDEQDTKALWHVRRMMPGTLKNEDR